MPLSSIHQRKKQKNFILLGLIGAWIALIFAITVIKMAPQKKVCYDMQDETRVEISCITDDPTPVALTE